MSPIDALLTALTLSSTGARTSEDIFTGSSHWMPSGRVFGGQVVAQALVAAQHTIDDERPVHSLHGYFLRPGDITKPITFAVDRLHDGRSFSTRRTEAFQDGLPILSLISSFQRPDDSPGYAVEMPSRVVDPESLPTVHELLDGLPESEGAFWARERPFDIRHVNGSIYLNVDGERTPHQALWMRAIAPLPDDVLIHRAALAYASDLSILEPVLRGLGIPWATPNLRVASLDHAMWFHSDARADEWLLYAQESTAAGSGRGLSFGRFFTREGALVATVAQEGMVRVPRRS